MMEEIKQELAKYRKEFEEDIRLDQLNVLHKQYKLASIKHKWVVRYSKNKFAINDRKEEKKKAIDIATSHESVVEQFKVNPKRVLDKLNKSRQIQEITEQIDQLEMKSEYLYQLIDIIKGMSFDIKNIIELRKIEEVL